MKIESTKLNIKRTLIVFALGLGLYGVTNAVVLPLLNPGEEPQLASRFSVGTQTSGSLFSVADGHLKIEPEDGQTGKTLGVAQNALSIGDIRIGAYENPNGRFSTINNLLSSFDSTLLEIPTNTGADDYEEKVNTLNKEIKNSLRYPTSTSTFSDDDGDHITVESLAPQQSVNVHGKVVMEGVKAQNVSTASDPLCITPNGTITRCSLNTGYKWVKTGWGACENVGTPINNTVTNITNHNIPLSCGLDDIYDTEEVSSASFQYLESKRKQFADLSTYFIRTLSTPKAHAAQIQTFSDDDGEWIYCSALPTPPHDGFTGIKSMQFACYDMNACSIVDDQNCIETIGAKPSYQSSCSAPASDTNYTCSTLPNNHPSCVQHLGVCMREVS